MHFSRTLFECQIKLISPALPKMPGHCLGPIGDPQLLVDILQVKAYGVLADVEFAADLGVGQAAGEQGEHLFLAGR